MISTEFMRRRSHIITISPKRTIESRAKSARICGGPWASFCACCLEADCFDVRVEFDRLIISNAERKDGIVRPLTMAKSYAIISAMTVTPCSLHNTAAPAATRDQPTVALLQTPFTGSVSACVYVRKASRKKRPDRTSARPTMLDTASVWMGCTANSRPAAATDHDDAPGRSFRAANTKRTLVELGWN